MISCFFSFSVAPNALFWGLRSQSDASTPWLGKSCRISGAAFLSPEAPWPRTIPSARFTLCFLFPQVAIKIISTAEAPVEYTKKFLPREIYSLNVTYKHLNVVSLCRGTPYPDGPPLSKAPQHHKCSKVCLRAPNGKRGGVCNTRWDPIRLDPNPKRLLTSKAGFAGSHNEAFRAPNRPVVCLLVTILLHPLTAEQGSEWLSGSHKLEAQDQRQTAPSCPLGRFTLLLCLQKISCYTRPGRFTAPGHIRPLGCPLGIPFILKATAIFLQCTYVKRHRPSSFDPPTAIQVFHVG